MARLTALGTMADGGHYATDGKDVFQLVPNNGGGWRAAPVDPDRQVSVMADYTKQYGKLPNAPAEPGIMSDLGHEAMIGGAGIVSSVGQVSGSKTLQNLGDSGTQYWQQGLSPRQAEIDQQPMLNDDFSAGPALTDGVGTAVRKVAGITAQSALPMALMGGVGGKLAQAGMAAGMSPEAAGVVGSAISEGGLTGVMDAGQVGKMVDDAPEEKLVNSEAYQTAYHELPDTMDDATRRQRARQVVKQKAMNDVGWQTSVATAILGAPAGAYFGRIIGGEAGKSLISTMAKQGLLEALQEGPQSAVEQAAQNRSVQRFVDPNQSVTEGLADQALQGIIAGATMGAGMGGLAHTDAQHARPMPARTDGGDQPEPEMPLPETLPVSGDAVSPALSPADNRIREIRDALNAGRPVSPSLRRQAQEVIPEQIDLAPPPPQTDMEAAADELASQMREPAPANNIDVTTQDMPVENIDAAPAPVEQPIPVDLPATNIDVRELPVESLTQPPIPDHEDHLQAQIEAVRSRKKRAVLLPADHEPVDIGPGIVALDVPQGRLYARSTDSGGIKLKKAIQRGDEATIRSLVGQMTLGVPPDVANANPAEIDRVVQNRDENGAIISQVGATADTEQAAANETKGQGATQETVPVNQALLDRQKPVEKQTESPIDVAAHEAATSPKNDLAPPTEAQQNAGNYKKGHVTFQGHDISIENPVGSTRAGKDPSGKPWSVDMSAHYGYIKRTTGADGDQVDVYLPDKPDPTAPTFVFDQMDPATGKFDEHKAVLGVASREEAERIYDAHFSDKSGPKRRRAVTAMSADEFKAWLKSGDTTKSASGLLDNAPDKTSPQTDKTAEKSTRAPDKKEDKSADTNRPVTARIAHRDRLVDVAKRIGVKIVQAHGGYRASQGSVEVPDGDVDSFYGAKSADHVFAHELAHAIMHKRGTSYAGFPKAEMVKRIPNWGDLVSASKSFRPGVHDHANARVRRHAMKPNEIIADAIASVLMGEQSIDLIRPLMKSIGLKDHDLGVAQGSVSEDKAAAPLYASRPVNNASTIIEWAKAQGFKTTLAPDDLHVTIAYSREPVSGARLSTSPKTVSSIGGKRSVEPLGSEGAVVLKFISDELQSRWKQYRDAGALWDYDEYTPHITITYDAKGLDISKVKPYTGPIDLGAEKQEALNVDKADDYKEAGEVDTGAQPSETKPTKKPADKIEDFGSVSGAKSSDAGANAGEESSKSVPLSAEKLRNLVRADSFIEKLNDLLKIPVGSQSTGASTNAVDGKTASPKSFLNGVRRHTQALRDILEGKAFSQQPFGSRDAEAQRLVLSHVFSLTHSSKVLDAVVKFIPVDVMDYLASAETSPKMVFQNRSVLKNALSVGLESQVAAPSDFADSLVRAVAFAGAEVSSGGVLADLIGPTGNIDAAVGTLDSKHGVTPNSDAVSDAGDALTSPASPMVSDEGTVETRETDKGTIMFAARERFEPDPNDDPVTAALKIMAPNDDMYQYPISKRKTVAGITREIEPGWQVHEEDTDDGKVTVVSTNDSWAWIKTPGDGTVHINVGALFPGTGGSAIYHIAANYAYNNGLVFEGDPQGLTKASIIRRTENMLSSALKFGTTRHLRPAEEQSLPWREGDDDQNLRTLVRASERNMEQQYPGLKDLRYNFDTRRVVDSNGNPLSENDFRRAVDGTRNADARAGRATVTRAALFNTLVSPEGREVWDGILAKTGGQPGSFSVEGDLAGAFYAQSRSTEQARPSAGLSASGLRDYLTKKLGDKVVNNLLTSGIVRIVSADDAVVVARTRQASAEGGRVYGFYDEASDTTYLIHDHLTDTGARDDSNDLEDGYAILVHELGVHYGMEGLLGPDTFKRVLKQMRFAGKANKTAFGQAVRAAYAQVPKWTRADHVDEEALAWLVTDHANHDLPFVKRVLAKIRAFLVRLGFTKAMNTDALVELARGAVARAAGEYDNVGRGGQGIRLASAYHGSPHKFERFSLAHIGAGEGAQAYGWGMYFAENKDVAKDYARDGAIKYGDTIKIGKHEIKSGDWRFGPAVAAKNYIENGDPFPKNLSEKEERWARSVADRSLDIESAEENIYTVDISDKTIGKMLDWDGILSEQPKAVQDLAKTWGMTGKGGDIYGRDVMKEAQSRFGGPRGASEALNNNGIPGVRYWDAGSRGKNGQDGGGTRNFVLFDDSLATIKDVNGKSFDASNPDIRFAARNAGHDGFQQAARDWLGDHLTTKKKVSLWSRTVGSMYHLAEKVPEFKPVFDAGQRFLSDTSRIALQAESLAPDLFRQMTDMKTAMQTGRANDTDVAAAAKAVYAGTLSDQRVYTDDELRQRFALNDKQIGIYRQAMRTAHKSLDDLTKATLHRMVQVMGVPRDRLDRIRETTGGAEDFLESTYQVTLKATQKEARSALDKAKESEDESRIAAAQANFDSIKASIGRLYQTLARSKKLKDEAYFPLMRFGRYSVDVTETDGATGEQARHYFGTFETEAEANKMARIMREEYPQAEVDTGILDKESWRLYPGLSPEVVQSFARLTGTDGSELMQEYLKIAVSNRSAMKRLIHRKGVPGFSGDVNRTLATFVLSNARMAASNYHMGDMRKAVEAIPKSMGDVREQAAKLTLYMTNPQEEFAGIRNFMFFNFLGGSIASAMTNLTQVPMATFPYLAAHKGAGRALLKWARPSAKPADDQHRAALERAEQEGIVSPQEVHNLMATARGGSLGAGRLLGARPVQTALYVWGSLFSAAEQYNRRTTFNAAYDIARKNGIHNPYGFAVKAVEETQFIYNRGNRPNWARGIGAPLFTFKQFSVNYLELLNRLPRRQKLLMIALITLAAGLEGLPFEEDIEDVIDTIAQWNGYAWSTRKELEEWAGNHLGKLAPVLLRGVSATGIPIDVQARLGLGNLIPGTAVGKPSELDSGREALEVLGAPGGVLTSAGRAAKAAAQGQWSDAAWAMAPIAVRNAAKGIEMWQEGAYLDSSKRMVSDTSRIESAMKGIGFRPAKVAQIQHTQSEIRGAIQLHRLTEDGIADKWARGIVFKKPDLVEQAKQELRDWNRKNPEAPMIIKPRQITSRTRALRTSQTDRFIKQVPTEMRSRVREALH